MPPLGLIPNRPAGAPDIISTGYGGGMGPAGSYSPYLPYEQSTYYQTRDAENYLREQARQYDAEYTQKQQKLDQDYKIARKNVRTAREQNAIDKWYREESVKNARERLALDAKIHTERLAFDRDVHADTMGLKRADLGYNLLNMQAQLRGPADYFAASNLARGVAAQPGSASFLDALKSNTNLAGFGGQAGVPDAVSVNSLAAKMGGGQIMPGTGVGSGQATDTDALHRQIQGIGAAGAHKLGAGALEQLSPTELQLFMGGLGTPGPDGTAFDVPTFMWQHRNSRIGQGIGGGGFRAA